MAKFTNFLNSPKERKEILSEFPEIKDIEDFMKIMWQVITFTEHSEQRDKPSITNVKRYENAMKAIFGHDYSKTRIPPDGYSYQDMREIVLQKNHNGNLEGSIKEFLENFYPKKEIKDKQKRVEYENKRETEFLKDFEAIKQHLYSAKHLYEGEEFEAGRGFPWE